jgi:glycosyltransferase involved in cell wall biosynthesis
VSRIRVLHLAESFEPGGVAWWLLDMYKALPNDEFEFDFHCIGTTTGERAQEVAAGGSRVSVFEPTLEEVLFGKQLKERLEQGRFEIVHSHLFNLSGWLLRHAHAIGIPCRLAHFHSTHDGRRDWIANEIRRRLGRRLVTQHATALLACSNAALSAAPMVHSGWRRVVYYGVNEEAFSPEPNQALRDNWRVPERGKVVGHVGRFYPEKNHEGLLRIFKRLSDRYSSLYLVLVGDGPLRPDVERLAERLGIQEQVRFVGARLDVPDMLRGFDLLLFPSLYEGFGLALIEARMTGLPVVASDLPAIREALAGADGYRLAPPQDSAAFTQATAELLEGPLRQLPPKPWRRKFSRERACRDLLDAYRDCLA